MNDYNAQNTPNNNMPDHVSYKCAFEIVVQGVRNGTWQGQIHWIDPGRTQYFRSVLEMLNLMDEALAGTDQALQKIGWTV